MKRPGFILSAITVAGMIFVGATTIAAASEMRGHGFARGGFGGHGFDGPQMAERLIRFLNLDDAQRDEVRGIVDAAQPQWRELSDAMRDSRQQLREIAEAEPLDTAALRTAADQQGGLISDMIVLGAGVMTEVRAVLTPEQLEDLEARMGEHQQGHRFGRRR